MKRDALDERIARMAMLQRGGRYIGNGAYCYANSMAMLLAQSGEQVSPAKLEVLTGVGVSALLEGEQKLPFFSGWAGLPDRGIGQALRTLGFEFVEGSQGRDELPPWDDLREMLYNGPVVLGPLDMGCLSYNPMYPYLAGVDHYVLAYGMKDEGVYIHDPAGYPFVTLSLAQLEQAWRSERVFYAKGSFRYWTAPVRVSRPTDEEIFDATLSFLRQIYQESEMYARRENTVHGELAIRELAELVTHGDLSPDQRAHLMHFALPVGARRAGDFAYFMFAHDERLAEIKLRQATLLGECQSYTVEKRWGDLSDTLRKLADVEEEFRIRLA